MMFLEISPGRHLLILLIHFVWHLQAMAIGMESRRISNRRQVLYWKHSGASPKS